MHWQRFAKSLISFGSRGYEPPWMTEGTAGNGHLLRAGDWEEQLRSEAQGIPARWWGPTTAVAQRRSKPRRRIIIHVPAYFTMLHLEKCTGFLFHPNFRLTKTWNSTEKEKERDICMVSLLCGTWKGWTQAWRIGVVTRSWGLGELRRCWLKDTNFHF